MPINLPSTRKKHMAAEIVLIESIKPKVLANIINFQL